MADHISKVALRQLLGFTTDAQLAEFFQVTQSAVSQWKDDAPVPELRLLQARAKRPDAFESFNDEEQSDPKTIAAVVGIAAADSTDANLDREAA